MRHRVFGKRLGRTTGHRIAMRRNMAAALIQHGAIRTTAPKAKELRTFIEKLITKAKKGTLHARRQVVREFGNREMVNAEEEVLEQTVVQKLFDEIAPRYANRDGGYTRTIRLSERRLGDAGSQVVLQLVEESSAEGAGKGSAGGRARRAAKRRDAAAGIPAATATATEEQAEEGQAEEQAPEAAEAPAAEAETEDQAGEAEQSEQGGEEKKEES